ncbi:hypothetical protein [Candidatus Accumulibacter vicinus]|uniref:Transmembrane protein n=1 Tax=Candidatus Accumulibacter vicinus TaxID=2954382 RepID=A0A084XUR3_9PROT|nr:hypothetical protein [Candidatus Accumulibacter vicinus]KFB66207.1 MAG: hypothetical protein CAPSK01_004576 [Candidatus Accumulibacter vicinus]
MTDPTRHIHAPGDAERRVGELIGPARHLRVESACREASVLADMLAGSDRRIDAIMEQLPDRIEGAVGRAMAASHQLTAEQHQWVLLAIQREAQSIRLRQAIIEKTLAGLVWAAVVGLGALVYHGAVDYLQTTLRPKP